MVVFEIEKGLRLAVRGKGVSNKDDLEAVFFCF